MYGKFAFFPEAASKHAQQVDLLYLTWVGLTLFFTGLVFFLLLFFAIRYRQRPGNEVATAVQEHWWVELGWSVIPLVIALGMFAWGARLYFNLYVVPTENVLEIFATGKQWMWKFQHPEGRREINHLHVPTGRPVKMTMISQDVIHSFFLPAMRVKHDVLPFRYTSTWFEATKPGVYHLFCAEYCGTEHARMIGTITVMTPEDYQAWLASPLIEGGQPRDGSTAGVNADAPGVLASAAGGDDATLGKALLEAQGCRACHRPDSAALAPILEGIYGEPQELADGKKVIADDNYLRESILVSTAKVVKGYQPVMPPYQGIIKEEEIRQIIAYIKATSKKAGSSK